MGKQKPQTPKEAVINFFEKTSLTDMLWIIIACLVGYLIFLIARRQYRRNTYTAVDLAVWGTATFVLAILTYSVLAFTIGKDGATGWGWYILCFMIAFLGVYAVHKELWKYQRLITTLITIIIGSCLFWSFIEGEQSIMYGIASGVGQGACSQLFLTTFIRYFQSLKSSNTNLNEENQKWENENRRI